MSGRLLPSDLTVSAVDSPFRTYLLLCRVNGVCLKEIRPGGKGLGCIDPTLAL